MATAVAEAVAAAAATGVLDVRRSVTGDVDLDELASVLESLPACVRRVDASHTALGDGQCAAVAAALRSSASLEELDLSSTDITGDGLAVIADALAANASVKSLSLRGCKIGVGHGVQRLAAALRTNTTLTRLDAGEMDLNIDAIAQFRIALSAPGGNTTLTELCLDRPVRGPTMRPMIDDGADDVAGHVGDLLKLNGTLRSLSLRKVGFTDSAAAVIADGLARNASVVRLDLGNNRIGRDGAARIAAVVAASETVEELVLDGNPIQDEGLLAICDAVAAAPTASLRLLDVSRCGVLGAVGHKTGHLEASGVECLARTAAAVPSLREFRVWGNPAVCAVGKVDHAAAAAVAEVLASGAAVADVRPYEVDGVWHLAHER